VIVPTLVMMPLEKVVAMLKGDLTLGNVTLERSPKRASEVLRQAPEADVKVEAGTAVDLWVGTGNATRDFATARVLIRRHPAIIEANIPLRNLTLAENRATMKKLADLAELATMDLARVAALMPGQNKAHAKAWQSVTKSVLAQFPGK